MLRYFSYGLFDAPLVSCPMPPLSIWPLASTADGWPMTNTPFLLLDRDSSQEALVVFPINSSLDVLGATATLIAYPFDFLKTRMSIQAADSTYKHIGQAIMKIYITEVILPSEDLLTRVSWHSIEDCQQHCWESFLTAASLGWWWIHLVKFVFLLFHDFLVLWGLCERWCSCLPAAAPVLWSDCSYLCPNMYFSRANVNF